MSEKIEIVRGSGNVFRDVGLDDADNLQIKSELAAEIVAILDRRKLTTRAAGELVGIDHSRISDIRNSRAHKFSIDRLVRILNALDRHVTVQISKVDNAA